MNGSFATYYVKESGDNIVDINKLVNILSKGSKNIPKHLSQYRAVEICLLAKAFKKLNKMLSEYRIEEFHNEN